MRRFAGALGVAIFVTVLASCSTEAQGLSPYSADVNVGVWLQQTTGTYKDRDGGGFAGEVTVARRFHASSASGLVVAANGAHYLKIGSNDSCTLLPDGGCAPELPSVRLVGGMAGWETRSGAFRAMGGLAYADPTSGGGALALQARLDLAVRLVRRMALTASLRPAVIPNYHGDTFRLLGTGIGIRIR